MEEMKESYHPFRSKEAKETYLTYYGEHVKHWPIASESKMVETSFGQTFVRVSGPKDGSALARAPDWVHKISTERKINPLKIFP